MTHRGIEQALRRGSLTLQSVLAYCYLLSLQRDAGGCSAVPQLQKRSEKAHFLLLSQSVRMFTPAHLSQTCLIVSKSPAGGKHLHVCAHTHAFFFSRYQQMDFWHPLWWLHTITINHKAKRRKRRRKGSRVYHLPAGKHNLDAYMLGHKLVLLPWQLSFRMLSMPHHRLSTHTHFLRCWWMFGGWFFLQQDLKHPFALRNGHEDKTPLLFCFSLFSNKENKAWERGETETP